MLDSGSKEDLEALELAIALSQRSNHPVSRALTSLDGLLHQNGASLSERISEFRAVPGTHKSLNPPYTLGPYSSPDLYVFRSGCHGHKFGTVAQGAHQHAVSCVPRSKQAKEYCVYR